MSRLRDALLLLVLLGAGIATGGGGTFAQWSSSSENPGNSVATGRIDIAVGSSTPMFAMGSAAPGWQPTKCVVVTNAGTLSTKVGVYGQISGTLVPYLRLRVTRGQKGATCASPGTTTSVFSEAWLNTFPTTSGGAIVNGGPWASGDSYPYLFALWLDSDPAAQGKTATIGMTWEATP
jgi:predicted ribosomally synthesized peptide with SipW-like signal peptide